MSATITQNLPGGVARTARSERQSRSSSGDENQNAAAFDATLKRSVERSSKRRAEAAAADAPISETRRSEKSDRSESADRAGRKKSESVEQQPEAANPAPAQGEQEIDSAVKPEQPVAEAVTTSNAAAAPPVVEAEDSAPSEADSVVDTADGESVDLQNYPAAVQNATISPAAPDAVDATTTATAAPADAIVASPSAAPVPSAAANPAVPVDSNLDTVDPAQSSTVTGQPLTSADAANNRSSGVAQQVPAGNEVTADGDEAGEPIAAIASRDAKPDAPVTPTTNADTFRLTGQLSSTAQSGPQKLDDTPAPAQPAAVPTPQSFAETNHPQITTAIRGQLLPNGGSMQIRLDPPEMGALLVQVTLRNGVIDASFQTTNPEATQALSHSLTQLKHSLESQGVSVDKLQVSQAPRSERSDNSNDQKNNQQQQGQQAFDWERQSDQQRKEMLKRMWAKLGAGDPLDLVA